MKKKTLALLSVASCLLVCTLAPAEAYDTGGRVSKIGPGVREAIRSGEGANVLIALVSPPVAKAAPIDLAMLQREVASVQRDVLSVLQPSDYRARRTFSSVTALAGTLLTERGLDRLAAHPRVVMIALDEGGRGSLGSSVPVINADDRHALGNTGSGVVVAVIDSGMDTDHSNLGDDLIHEECFLDDDGAIDGAGLCPNGSDRQSGPGAAEDDAGHGSHVTGIVTSNGTLGSVGVSPDADIVSIKVTAGPTFSGVFFFFSEVVAALDWVIANPQHGIKIINMSIGTNAEFAGDCDAVSFNPAGAAAINTLRASGVIAFASAGNSGSGTSMTSPACLSNVMSVGASDNFDLVAAFSNSNASTDVFAPGVEVLSSDLLNSTAIASGTSMASPHAAGCAALLVQTGEATTPNAIETRLETSPVSVTDPTNGLSFPRIDCSPAGPASCEDPGAFPQCNLPCPIPTDICVNTGADCVCEPPPPPIFCEDPGVFPQCDLPCPIPTDICVNTGADCVCEPPPPPIFCEDPGVFPQCDLPCPIPTDICVNTGADCVCEPPPPPIFCEDPGVFPQCDLPCPIPTDICVNTGADCVCEPPPPIFCEDPGVFPQCDLPCPIPTDICVNTGNACLCEPPPPVFCEDPGVFPQCDLPCPDPTREICVNTGNVCVCEPRDGACCRNGPGTETDCFITTEEDCLTNHHMFFGPGSECTSDIDCVSLVVMLDSFSAKAAPRGVLLSWTTAMEIDTIGFRVLRQTAGTREKALGVVAEFIPALGHGLAGASYELLDDSRRSAFAVHYFLEDIDIQGRVTRHGPFAVERGTRSVPGGRGAPPDAQER